MAARADLVEVVAGHHRDRRTGLMGRGDNLPLQCFWPSPIAPTPTLSCIHNRIRGRFSSSRRRKSVTEGYLGPDQRRQMTEPRRPRLSLVRQCELPTLNRSGVHYRPVPESEFSLTLMRWIA